MEIKLSFSDDGAALVIRLVEALEAIPAGSPVDEALGKAADEKIAAASGKGKAAGKKAPAKDKDKGKAPAKPKKMTKAQLTKIKTAVGETDLDKAALLAILKDQFNGAESISALDSSQVEDFILAIGTATVEPEADEDDPLAGLV